MVALLAVTLAGVGIAAGLSSDDETASQDQSEHLEVEPTTSSSTSTTSSTTTSTTSTSTTSTTVAPRPTTPPAPTRAPQPAPVEIPAPEPPAVGPEPADDCHPSYAGVCVPIASDVDCAGGSGNGPAYARGPFRVVGPDVYDLDRDGDGTACE